MDYIQNPDKYGITQDEYNAAITVNMQPRAIDVNNLSLQMDVPDIPSVLGSTGKGYLDIANFNDEAYKTNFVDPNTGRITSKNRTGISRKEMSNNMFLASMNEAEGVNRERLLRDFYLVSVGRENDTRLKFDARDQRAMDAWIQQHPDFEDHIDSVNQTLADIKSNNKTTIMVFNKIDAFKHLTIDEDDLITEKTKRHFTLQEWKTTWMNNVGKEKAIFISATNKENFEEFRERVYEAVREIHISRFPYNKFLYPDFKDAKEKEED